MIVVKNELADSKPEVVSAVYEGFKQAKQVCEDKLIKGMTFNNMTTMIPWLSSLIADDRRLLGDDWWPYGITRNRAAFDAFQRARTDTDAVRVIFGRSEPLQTART